MHIAKQIKMGEAWEKKPIEHDKKPKNMYFEKKI